MTESETPQPQPGLTQEARQKGADARRDQQEANIEVVRKLAIRGVRKPLELQAYFKRLSPPIEVSIRTIARYKSIIKSRTAKEIIEQEGLHKTTSELVYELKETFEEVNRELWMIVNSSKTSPRDKISAMAEINRTADKWLDKMQSLGLIHKEPDKLQFIGKDGKPAPPPEFSVDIQKLEVQFVQFVKTMYQNPIGATGDHHPITRPETKPNGPELL